MKEVVLIRRSDYGTTPVIAGFCDSKESAERYISLNSSKYIKFTTEVIENLNAAEDNYICYNCNKILDKSDIINSFDETGTKYLACYKCGQIVINCDNCEIDLKVIDFFANTIKIVVDLYKTFDATVNIPENLKESCIEVWNYHKNSSIIKKIILNRVLFDKAPNDKEEKDIISEIIDDLTNIIMDQIRKDNNIDSSSSRDDAIYTLIWNDVFEQIFMY